MSSSNFSPSRGATPANSRLHQLAGGGGGGIAVASVSRLRSSSLRKPPEPLRRAVADCLSSSTTASSSSPSSVHGNPSFVATEASRTLRDYVAAPVTTDLAYSVILEYTIAERERSPAVVARCVALLKRYLLRYKPSEETLIQIDRFCMGTIAECDINTNRKSPPWSRSLNQQSVSSMASTNSSPLPVSAFASGALVKSLNYVRSLVAQQIPKRISHTTSFIGVPASLRHSLSTVLSRSLSSQLNPSNIGESSEDKDSSALSVSNLLNIEKTDATKQLDYIAVDVLKWRWLGEHHLSFSSAERVDLQTMRTNNIIESGAAALFVGDMEAKLKGQPWKYFGTADMPYLDQLLQPSSVTTITNAASARSHLRAITASKRNKASPGQIWEDSAVSTFRPRAKPLFQYRHYSEQQPLRLNPAEVGEVIMAVSSETYAPSANHLTMSSRLSNNSGKPSMDVAVSVLIKLIIDMYILDSGTAAPLTLFMLEEMLSSPKAACRVRAFDLILNLGVHAHLLEPMMVDDTSTIEEDYSQGAYFDSQEHFAARGNDNSDSVKSSATSSAINNFESWILNILYEILLLLVQREDKEESVWSSALSCLLYFVCDRGKILRSRLEGLDIRVIKTLIEISRTNSWAELVHGKLICMLTNMLYQLPDNANDPTVTVPKTAELLIDQVNLIGGIEFILYEYSFSNFREERRNLFLVLFEYVLRQINEDCVATGVSEYSDDEINPLVTMLALADAPEVFYISVKLGVEGLGELLRRSISDTLHRYPNNERLKMLLDNVMEKFEALISSYTHLDKEFSRLVEITKTYKFLDSIRNAPLRNGVAQQARLSWATLHSLLHSDRIAYRQNGYTWLGDLLIAEISEGNDGDIWSNIRSLQRKIVKSGDSSVTPDIPLSISLMCGLLKSKNSVIRWGFLHILERFLMRCKFLLDENEMQESRRNAGHQSAHSRLEKANAVVDIMSSALSLVAQITETDRINILKMCDILFSQLCLKVGAASSVPSGENTTHGKSVGGADESKKIAAGRGMSQQENCLWNEVADESDSRSGYNTGSSVICETASMAALLLQGKAIVPMQLVARVPTALFYWPLLQLAGAATDNIALGVAVGSKGRGNLPGATSDIRATLLLLLIGKCTANSSAIEEVGGEDFFRELLDDTDSRVAYYSSGFLLKRMMSEKPDEYQHKLQNLVFKAQQSNNEKLLENPYLQMRGIIQLSNDGL